MDTPFFTIIMPTYNQSEFIETSLKSIFNQNNNSYELLIYDALSTDDTPEILEKYKDKLTWYREKDSGMSEAINKGLMAGKGEVFAWLCSDDVYLPRAFQRVLKAFTQDSELDFVYGDAIEMDGNGNIFSPNLFTEDYDTDRYLYSHNYICQPTIFFKKSVINKVGTINEKNDVTMDYEWFAKFHLTNLKGKRLPFFLAANRDRPETKTNAGGMKRYKNMIYIHAIRPGKPLIFRKSFWVYTFEAFIKAINAVSNSKPKKSRLARFLKKISSISSRLFLKFVNPRSQHDIIKRFLRDVDPYGRNINDLWESFISS